MKFESYSHLIYQAFFFQCNENSINNQDLHSQNEDNEIPEVEYPNENDSEDTEINEASAIPNFMLQILPDDCKGQKFLKFKAKGSLQCGSYMLKIM